METQNKIVQMYSDYPELDEATQKEQALKAAWALTHAALWPRETFEEKEILHFKFLISEHFESGVSIQKNLIRYCVRVMLTKQMYEQRQFYVLDRPHVWLNKNYAEGHNRSKKWYDHLVHTRARIAGYSQGLFLLAFGMYRYAMKPSTKEYQSYRHKLKHQQCYYNLQTFNSAITFFNHLSA